MRIAPLQRERMSCHVKRNRAATSSRPECEVVTQLEKLSSNTGERLQASWITIYLASQVLNYNFMLDFYNARSTMDLQDFLAA